MPTSPLRRFVTWLADGPAYPPDAGDRRTVSLVGLEVPVRATIALVAVALLLLLDYHGRINGLVENVLGIDPTTAADGMRIQGLGRVVLFGAVPIALIVLLLRDRPTRYGLVLGDVRAGLTLAVTGCLVMVPIVLLAIRTPGFAAYYAPQTASLIDVVLTTALDVIPAELFFRGFLLFVLLRSMGPVAVIVTTLPFAFAHLGKPELETMSTLGGGLIYGWLDWRTGSVLWSGLAHTFILSFTVLASAAIVVPGAS
jgi:membrane protease YdiL (CAAX protease family)